MNDVILYKEDIDRLNGILQNLVNETKILSAILVNKDTRLLANCGSLAMSDISALAALIVGSFASTQGIAGLIGEEEFSMMSHCGKTKNLLITVIDDDTILATIFNRTISLSSVSLSITKHVEELKVALFAIKNNTGTMFQPEVTTMSLSQDDVELGFNTFFEVKPQAPVAAPQKTQPTKKQPPQTVKVAPKPNISPYKDDNLLPRPPETTLITGSDMHESVFEIEIDKSEAIPVSASELEKSILKNKEASTKFKNIPPPSNTEHLYVTSMSYLKNKAKEGAVLNKHAQDKNILSKFFNRPK